MKPRLLDLFCGAGGAAMGYARAGFEVVGVDIKPQPHYPFEFHRFDGLEYLRGLLDGVTTSRPRSALGGFDAIHASPPCQAFSASRPIRGRAHVDLLTPTRELLRVSGLPWVIENVPGAPMRADVTLCGSMFGLEVQRHRWFELGEFGYMALDTEMAMPPPLLTPPPHIHEWERGRPVGVYGHTGGKSTGITSGNHGWSAADWREAMGIDWMTRDELAQAIPPAYTQWIGRYLMTVHMMQVAA